jgi:hypothetical protein
VGPYVLFLRQSSGAEVQLIPDLRPAGGDGVQGLFEISLPIHSNEFNDCFGFPPGAVERCNAFLEWSQTPISVQYSRDPLFKKYNGVPVSTFLEEVQSVARSLAYATPADPGK